MKLEKQDVGGVWVKTNEQPPEINKSYCIRYKGVVQYVSYEFEGNKFSCDSDPSCIIYDTDEVEWLRFTKDVYILTENQLETIKQEAYGIGVRDGQNSK